MKKFFKNAISAVAGFCILALGYFILGQILGLVFGQTDLPEPVSTESVIQDRTDLAEEVALPYSELMSCSYCGEDFPKKYQFETYDGDPICPNCIRDDFNALINGEIRRCLICDSFYFPEDSYGYGLCWDCSLEYLSGCSFCGQYTFRWHNEDGFSLCPECAGNLYSDESIQQAIESWIEG